MPPPPAEVELDLPGRGQPTGPWSRQKQHREPCGLEKAGNAGWLRGIWSPWQAGPLGIGLGTHQRDTWVALSAGEAGHLLGAARTNGTGSPSYHMGAHGDIKAPSPLKALPVAEERPCLHGLQCPLQPETGSQGVDRTRAAQGSRGPGAGQGPADEAGQQEGGSGVPGVHLNPPSGPFCPGQQDTDRPSRSGPTLVWGAASMDTRQPWGRLRECRVTE
ncbi:hypothetical protein GH733_005110 [Mirounga leonina]|nr:hypothetical protein GH733_005110 [Mirounga leonina]